MVRHHLAVRSEVPVRLLYSARSLDVVIYRDELMRAGETPGIDVRFALTREQPAGWTGYARRIDRAMLEDVAWPASENALTYVCGPTAFVEAAAAGLVELGHDPARIRTERFGPTGR